MADPLDRRSQLAQLGNALQDAAARADWDGLGEHARDLIPRLRALAARGPWSTEETVALERLRVQHDRAALHAASAARALEPRLDEMRANKDGWIAYAMFSEQETGTSQE